METADPRIVREYFERYVPLNFLEWRLFRKRLERRSFRAGEVILHQGDVCRTNCFIVEGVARSAILTEEGKDLTWAFHYRSEHATVANLFVVDYESLVRQTPSRIHIEAMEPCVCYALDHSSKHWLYRHSAKYQELGRKMAEEAYCYLHRFHIRMRTLSPAKRYALFLKEHPDLVDRVPQYHIATYLGITPQHLSRLKKKTPFT